ncbi:VOC family protein [uncultured Streptomyces sp.]|uniref:VOC family protein n=1 Tax=uncultured Streptomyces sp. TaxID=174707 RepID=UPI002614C950|nr:VOC family protein [uncultured Streptomyces sp.]
MATPWALTFDCADPVGLAAFWALALGYEPAPPPEGFDTWHAWYADQGVPEAEWDDGAGLRDPEGIGPGLSFLKVPEPKRAKNRLHLDIKAGGGRQTPWETRWPRVTAAVDRLTAAGARVASVEELNGRPDHFVLEDPEGNVFCVV